MISRPAWWTRGAYARTRDGCGATYDDKAAYQFCAVGVLRRAAYLLVHGRSPGHVTDVIECKITQRHLSLIDVNDGENGHRKVLALFDKALAE
jgi:hypothetical protein